MPIRLRSSELQGLFTSSSEFLDIQADLELGDIAPKKTFAANGVTRPVQDVGTVGDLQSSIVTVRVETLDSPLDVHHLLNVGVPPGPTPGVVPIELNVGWIVCRVQHDGTGASTATGGVSATFEAGDTVSKDVIQLRFYAPGRTVDATHPLYVSLMFFPTSQ